MERVDLQPTGVRLTPRDLLKGMLPEIGDPEGFLRNQLAVVKSRIEQVEGTMGQEGENLSAADYQLDLMWCNAFQSELDARFPEKSVEEQ